MNNNVKIIEASSLQEFISILDKDRFSGNFYYRGEPRDYSQNSFENSELSIDTRNMASGYRWMLQNKKTFQDLLYLRKDYYREIGHTLSVKETENFIAYAQHHGLPTELLDITSNPIVALYFACEHNQDNEDGFLYLFDNNLRNPDIRPTNKFYDSLYHDLTTSLISNQIEKQYIRFNWFNNIDKNHMQKEEMEKANEFVYYLFNGSESGNILSNAYLEYRNLKKANDLSFLLIDEAIRNVFDSKDIQEVNQVLQGMFSDKSIEDHIYAQQAFYINSSMQLIGKGQERFFPELKLLLHQPSIIFDRMRNQDGHFIYQLCYEYANDFSNQKVVPSHTIIIPASQKRKIISQLDRIGINQKFIYPDHDNIAKYFMNNYKKSFWEKLHPFG